MKRILLATAATLALSNNARAQIPVTDGAAMIEWGTSIANEVKSYGLQIQQSLIETKQYVVGELAWTQQVQAYALQASQYATEGEQLYGFIHNPSLGAAMGMMNMAGLGSGLPVSPYAVMGLVNGFSYPGPYGMPNVTGILGSLSMMSGAAYAKNHIYSPTDGSWDSQQLIANGNNIAGAQGAYVTTTSDLQKHAAVLQALRDHLATATTPKDVQDAQAQIALEQTWTANEAAQMAAIQAAAQTQKDSAEQRDKEALAQSFDQFIERANALPWQ
jgi:hypothetical protein